MDDGDLHVGLCRRDGLFYLQADQGSCPDELGTVSVHLEVTHRLFHHRHHPVVRDILLFYPCPQKLWPRVERCNDTEEDHPADPIRLAESVSCQYEPQPHEYRLNHCTIIITEHNCTDYSTDPATASRFGVLDLIAGCIGIVSLLGAYSITLLYIVYSLHIWYREPVDSGVPSFRSFGRHAGRMYCYQSS